MTPVRHPGASTPSAEAQHNGSYAGSVICPKCQGSMRTVNFSSLTQLLPGNSRLIERTNDE